jgi:hypothetical protein
MAPPFKNVIDTFRQSIRLVGDTVCKSEGSTKDAATLVEEQGHFTGIIDSFLLEGVWAIETIFQSAYSSSC